jgi:uncharacterized RDD family membrane protein YckC
MSPHTLPAAFLRSYDRLIGWLVLPLIALAYFILWCLDKVFGAIDEDPSDFNPLG